MKDRTKRIIRCLLLAGSVFGSVLLLNMIILINAYIPTSSMENTISKGSKVVGNRLAYIFSDPQRYDIVFF